MKTIKRMGLRNYLLVKLNCLYSVVWIKLNKSNKHQYRECSNVHKMIVSLYK